MSAYNNREWDRGKDWSQDPAAWQDSRPNVRHRDDDSYQDPKRRKFNNNNAYDPSDFVSWPQDHGHEDHPRPGQLAVPKKRLVPSEPSPHVIFLGLDPDFTEADLQAYLLSNGCSVETVTIIRERSTGVSKGFGFAQFTSVDHARAFVDPLFPFIQVPPPASHGASVTAAFYKALETGLPHNGRRVKIDYSQSAIPHDKGRINRANLNDGTRDIGSAQSSILLFRGLDPLSGPQAIYQAMLYSSGPGRQSVPGMRRIILIKDKVTMASFGFAFVEFVDIQSAATVLAATMSPQLHPSGFRISDRPVAASFAHPYSFQPVTDFLQRDEACLASTISLGGAEGSWVRYWDESSTVAVLEFQVEEPTPSTPAPTKEKEKRKKIKESDAQTKTPAPSVLPLSDKPVLLSLSKGPVKSTPVAGPSKVSALGFAGDDIGDEEQDDVSSEPNKPMAVKKVAPLIASKKTVSNINKWNQVQEELAHNANPVTPISTPAAAPPRKRSVERSPAPDSEMEFADTSALMCLLCSRQFKTVDQLRRHNKESDLHKKNYQDPNLREIARQKVVGRKSTTDHPKYRDRASERRTLFNQPDAPLPDRESAGTKRRQAEAPAKSATPPPIVAPGKDQTNVGNKLLKMMGWKEGMGLGTEGEGRVDPIETAVYAQGAGLGASKGKDINKYTEASSSYAQMAQESARDRFNS